MRSIRIVGVKKNFEGDVVLPRIDLTIPSGSFFVLLGPSGSGKTTLLRLIGGFEVADSGEIFLGNENITHVAINERRVNTVFQQYALFPHMNVYENVAYSLRIRNIAPAIIEQKVKSVLAKVHLEKHIKKDINQLSGGQQQRVALARAIVNEPDVLLLDEPLAALDLKLREQMLVELIDLQYELKTTFVYVTHDQSEALTVASQMAIMNGNGMIEQIGTPKEIYENPISTFVARFVGTTNIFGGTFRKYENEAQFCIEDLANFQVNDPHTSWAVDGAHVYVSVRPERIKISKVPLMGFDNMLSGVVEAIVYYGRSTQFRVLLKNGMRVQVFCQNENSQREGGIDYDDEVYMYWHKNSSVLLEK